MKKIKKYSLVIVVSCLLGYIALLILDKIYPPDLSKFNNISQIATDRNGKWLRVYLSSDDKYRIKTRHQDLPDDYLKLLINYEDKDFYQHNGIDISAVFRAAWQNMKAGEVISGASTISMQTARLLMPQPRNLKGKIIQTFRAWQIEKRLTKSEILDIYTTLTPVGGNREGLTSASFYYLNKPVDKLSLGESAWLVALAQSPENLSKNSKDALISRNKILKRALENNVIDKQRYEQAIAEPLIINNRDFPFIAPHITMYAKNRVKHNENIIKTSLDKSLQVGLSQLLKQQLSSQHQNANFAGGILENNTGKWLAYVGSADFFSKKRKGQVDMLTAIRSPGSTLKPFITLFAFDWLNYKPETTIDDTPILSSYKPNNYDGNFKGRISLATALRLSRNVPAVKLLEKIKVDYFSTAIKDNGVNLFFPHKAKANLTLALGGVGIKADELAKLYSKLANCTFRDNKSLAKRSSCQDLTEILWGSHNKNGRIFFGKENVAFKTGTSYGWRDRWIFAYTKDYTIVLWNGRPDGQFAENKASSETLIPLLRQVIGILPNPPQYQQKLSTKKISNKDLPKLIKHIGNDEIANDTNTTIDKNRRNHINSLKIISPLNNSKIEYNDDMNIAIKVSGGNPPYVYILNDDIIKQTNNQHIMIKNITPGGYSVLVIDANGDSQNNQFYLEKNFSKSNKQNINWQ